MHADITLVCGAAIHGECDFAFNPVVEAFARNFTQHSQVGDSVCLSVDGHALVDL